MLVLLVVSSKDCDGTTSNAAVSVGPVVRACDTSLGTAADFVNCLSMNAASSGGKRPAAPLAQPARLRPCSIPVRRLSRTHDATARMPVAPQVTSSLGPESSQLSGRLQDGRPRRVCHSPDDAGRKRPGKGYSPSSNSCRQRMAHKASAQS